MGRRATKTGKVYFTTKLWLISWWQGRDPSKRNKVKASEDIRNLAASELNSIGKKLKVIYDYARGRERLENQEISTGNLVQILIQEATSTTNLVRQD